MPSLNITFTEEEQALLRQAAEHEKTSLKTFVHDAAISCANDRKRLRESLLDDIFIKSAELNRRLA
ncbi:DUF1778 domain-containing protein [Rhodococcus sp. NPDC060090]|uniref:type II toxin -antitoxin system TacA 1-like antitoxin n=1 Tax=Rhodococcus sp. NPDC060090 TaxID=3347056 RepID=UPI00364F825B